MRKPNVIQVAAGTTLALSMGANAWYGAIEWERGGLSLILAGVWMPVAIVMLERIMHALSLSKGQTYAFRIGLALVAAMCMYYSMSHLAHVATPEEATLKEKIDGWIVAVSVDVVMVLSGLALMLSKHKKAAPAAEIVERVVEKIVEVQVPVYIEREPASAPIHVEAQMEETETETVTETRQVTRTRRQSASMTAEQRERVLELIAANREAIAAGTRGVATEIMRKVELPGHPNVVTRMPEWKAIVG